MNQKFAIFIIIILQNGDSNLRTHVHTDMCFVCVSNIINFIQFYYKISRNIIMEYKEFIFQVLGIADKNDQLYKI